MREARICYDHLAGDRAVEMLESFLARGILKRDSNKIEIGKPGQTYFEAIGIDTKRLSAGRRPMCRACLDWSVRRSHLAGALGASIFDKILAERWARRDPESRAVVFSPKGNQAFARTFLPG